jgi:hypothetical protein
MAFGLVSILTNASRATAVVSPPNIVLIIYDDQN